jgi:N-acetylglucosaminyldiphosphoundecaprenol N-acetyl-beta-D-mannosaminyltransferase
MTIVLSDSPRVLAAGPRIELFGIPVDNVSLDEAVGMVLAALDGPGGQMVCFVNAHCVNLACRCGAYRDVLRGADYVFADGTGMRWAGAALGRPIADNVNGTDLFPRLAAALAGTGKRIFLLGGRPGVAEGVARWLAQVCPDAEVVGCHHGYLSAENEEAVVEQIHASQADLLLVAMGSPDQELWIHRHLERLGVKVAMGVGGLFDFFSGRVPRAPRWLRRAGLEWLYRFYQEPLRLWKRYLIGNAAFLLRLSRARWRLATAAAAPQRRTKRPRPAPFADPCRYESP